MLMKNKNANNTYETNGANEEKALCGIYPGRYWNVLWNPGKQSILIRMIRRIRPIRVNSLKYGVQQTIKEKSLIQYCFAHLSRRSPGPIGMLTNRILHVRYLRDTIIMEKWGTIISRFLTWTELSA